MYQLDFSLQETRLDESLIPLNLNPILKHLKSLGATIIPISIPSIKLALPAYYVLACAEASSNLARFGGGWYGGRGDEEGSEKPEVDLREQTRAWGFGDEVRKRILAGTHALTAG
jgi:aspartyl-tRNA(Asn)/glutamyl-tRNA(Gln) amidotransferase subunit A